MKGGADKRFVGFIVGAKDMGSANPLTGRSILVVEDEPLISIEMAALFELARARVLQGRTIAEAVRRTDGVSAAVLDYRLGDESVPALCTVLAQRQIPFMFYSGYNDLQAKSVVVPKPSSGKALLTAMAGLIDARVDELAA